MTAVVVSGCYSPIDQDIKQEEQVRDIAQSILPGARITISKEVAHIGPSYLFISLKSRDYLLSF